ncbi:YqzM family protein [Alkalicoccobacillus porphyridii]|uniref:YqzM family protein n=1 Tax=Alkalicoccobacillus porphyridii TaxID=2597270 RepID=A0A553ZZC8_9BACI|nr:YqzM family protein [Alkalicoccobacillus porphyridii]TSB46783.1 YqzM family protein [Alkalicoccobacillus porphyridii]
MNKFEEDVQSKRNDAIDSGVGFVASFGFFATLFIIASLVDVFSQF